MGNLLFKEDDPAEAKFLGMSFRCDKAHFAQAIKEEFELMFLIPYLLVFLQTKAWGALGIFWRKAGNISDMIEARWNSRVNVVASRAWHQYNNYEMLVNFGMEWMICDPIMFKYWIIHGINRWIPELITFGDDKEIASLILDMNFE